MIAVELTVEIARPPSEVFAYLADPANLPEWQSTVVRASAEGDVGLGSRVTEVRRFLGHEAESTLEVSEYEPDARLSLRALSGPVRLEVEHVLEPTADGTRLGVRARGEQRGLFRLAESVVGAQVERQLRSDFQRLKELLEAPRQPARADTQPG